MSAALKDFLISLCIFVVIGLAIVMVVTGDAHAKEKKAERTMKLTQAEADQCKAEGGCILISEKTAAELLHYMEALEQAAKSSCRSI